MGPGQSAAEVALARYFVDASTRDVIASLRSDLAAAKADTADAKAAEDAARQDCRHAAAAAAASDAAAAALRAELDAVRSDVDSRAAAARADGQSEATANAADRVAAAERRVTEMASQLAEVRERLLPPPRDTGSASGTAAVAAVAAERDEAIAAAGEQAALVAELQAEVARLEDSRAASAAAFAELRETTVEKALVERVVGLGKEAVAKKDARIAELDAALKELVHSHADATTAMTALEAAAAEAEGQAAVLRDELAEATRRAEEAETALAGLEADARHSDDGGEDGKPSVGEGYVVDDGPLPGPDDLDGRASEGMEDHREAAMWEHRAAVLEADVEALRDALATTRDAQLQAERDAAVAKRCSNTAAFSLARAEDAAAAAAADTEEWRTRCGALEAAQARVVADARRAVEGAGQRAAEAEAGLAALATVPKVGRSVGTTTAPAPVHDSASTQTEHSVSCSFAAQGVFETAGPLAVELLPKDALLSPEQRRVDADRAAEELAAATAEAASLRADVATLEQQGAMLRDALKRHQQRADTAAADLEAAREAARAAAADHRSATAALESAHEDEQRRWGDIASAAQQRAAAAAAEQKRQGEADAAQLTALQEALEDALQDARRREARATTEAERRGGKDRAVLLAKLDDEALRCRRAEEEARRLSTEAAQWEAACTAARAEATEQRLAHDEAAAAVKTLRAQYDADARRWKKSQRPDRHSLSPTSDGSMDTAQPSPASGQRRAPLQPRDVNKPHASPKGFVSPQAGDSGRGHVSPPDPSPSAAAQHWAQWVAQQAASSHRSASPELSPLVTFPTRPPPPEAHAQDSSGRHRKARATALRGLAGALGELSTTDASLVGHSQSASGLAPSTVPLGSMVDPGAVTPEHDVSMEPSVEPRRTLVYYDLPPSPGGPRLSPQLPASLPAASSPVMADVPYAASPRPALVTPTR